MRPTAFFRFKDIIMKSAVLPLAFITALAYSTPSLADHANGVGLKAGATGIGLEYYHGLSDNFNFRVGINNFQYDDDVTENDITYDAELELRTASAVFDYHPWDDSGFRISAGAYYNGSKVKAEARAVNGEYEFNGDVYRVEDVGQADGNVEFKKFAPYIGLGWASAPTSTSSWAFTAEIGAFYQSTPEAELNVTCGSALDPAICTQLLADVQVEQDELEEDIKEYKWYPVINFGVLYRF